MNAPSEGFRRQARWLVPLTLALALAFLGTRGLWEPDEGRYALCARGMVTSGDWLWPRLNGELHLTKPPLTYWAIAAPVALAGPNEWAARLYLGISFTLTTLLVSALARRLWDARAGLAAGLAHATTLLPFVAASVITPDTLLTLWETLALYAAWRAWSAETPRDRRLWPFVTGLAFGLAFLTKGPPGILFLPAFYLFRLFPAGRRREAGPVLNWSGLAAFLIVGFGWFAWVIWQRHDLIGYFLGNEVAGRLAGEHHRNSEWYGALVVYGPAFLLGGLPWNWTWWSEGRRLASQPEGLRRAVGARPRALFVALALAGPLAVFVVARSRLPFYVLPLLAPLSLVAGRGLSRRGGAVVPWRALAGWAILLLLLRAGAPFLPAAPDARRLARELGPDAAWPALALERHSHYGYTWYTGQSVRRVLWKATPGDAAPAMAKVLTGTAVGRSTCLILAHDRDLARLGSELSALGFRMRKHELTGELSGCVVSPAPAPADSTVTAPPPGATTPDR